jgi:hypothetical protein
MSSVQPVLHFGLGDCTTAEYVKVVWPDGKVWESTNVPGDQVLTVKYGDAADPGNTGDVHRRQMFVPVEMHAQVIHEESTFDDYDNEILLPYKLSTLGPVCAVADVDGNGTDDLYLGGSAGFSARLYLLDTDGQLTEQKVPAFTRDAQFEDGGARFFDIDADGDQDLYVASGGNEFTAGAMYQDRLYLNDGTGRFIRSGLLPEILESGSVVVPLDFDSDGDTDIFIGGRQVPGQYGRVPKSVLLRNDNAVFTDITAQSLPQGGVLGMLTDGLWTDINNDGTSELVICGEWMPVTVLQWSGEGFEKVAVPSLNNSHGMWNRIVTTDIDNDGDNDLVAGNLGLNNKYKASADMPFKMYVNDFDHNGSHDVYLGYYNQNDGEVYPVRGRECSSQQMPFVKKKYNSYESFAKAPIEHVLEGRMEGAVEQQARIFASGIFYNDGDMQFRFEPFVNNVQVSPVYAIVVEDFNSDGRNDFFLAGNYYNREVETTRSDAGIGALLLSHEDGLEYVHPSITGIAAYRDVRYAFMLRGADRPILGIANNNDVAQFYESR